MALRLGWGGAGPRGQVHGEANLWEGPVTLWTLLNPCCIQQQARLPFPNPPGTLEPGALATLGWDSAAPLSGQVSLGCTVSPASSMGLHIEKDGTCLAVQWLGLSTSLHWAQVQSLVGELRSYRPCTPNAQCGPPHKKTNTEGAQLWL